MLTVLQLRNRLCSSEDGKDLLKDLNPCKSWSIAREAVMAEEPEMSRDGNHDCCRENLLELSCQSAAGRLCTGGCPPRVIAWETGHCNGGLGVFRPRGSFSSPLASFSDQQNAFEPLVFASAVLVLNVFVLRKIPCCLEEAIKVCRLCAGF